jgi:hypothetical protein
MYTLILIALYVLQANSIIIPTGMFVFVWIMWAINPFVALCKALIKRGDKD